jgi:hypothetical protein
MRLVLAMGLSLVADICLRWLVDGRMVFACAPSLCQLPCMQLHMATYEDSVVCMKG